MTSFARLGFGIDQVKGFRPAAPAAWDPRVRRARPEDIPRLVELAEEVQEFHARPPMWRQPEPGVPEMVERGYRHAIEDGSAGCSPSTRRACAWMRGDASAADSCD